MAKNIISNYLMVNFLDYPVTLIISFTRRVLHIGNIQKFNVKYMEIVFTIYYFMR